MTKQYKNPFEDPDAEFYGKKVKDYRIPKRKGKKSLEKKAADSDIKDRITEKPLDKKVTFYEAPVLDLAKTLESKGYELAEVYGSRRYSPVDANEEYVGILKSRKPIMKKTIFGMRKKEQSPLFIGLFKIFNDYKWILEVYGRKNIPEVTGLAKEFANKYNVKIDVQLDCEEEKFGG